MNRTGSLIAGIVLLLLLFGLWPGIGYGGFGYYGISLVGLLLLVVIVMLILGRGDVP